MKLGERLAYQEFRPLPLGQVEASFQRYSTGLLRSFGLFGVRDYSKPGNQYVPVDQRFTDRFAAHALHHIDPQTSGNIWALRVPFTMPGNTSFGEEYQAYDKAAEVAFGLVVEEAKSRGARGYNQLQDQLRKVRNGETIKFPFYNRPNLSWRVGSVYRDCTARVTGRERKG